MKEKYYLNGESLPTIPVPHDCVIKSVCQSGEFIEFVFEDNNILREFIKYEQPEANSLTVRYHLADDPDDFSVYKWVRPKRPFEKDGHYKRIPNSELVKAEDKKLEYLYHNVGFCSIITKLFSDEPIILDAAADYVEFEW